MRPPKTPSALPRPRTPDEHVEAWRQRGVSARIYAAEHGLSASTLYGWRRAIRRRARSLHTQRILPVVVTPSTCCEVVFADGRTLRFPDTLAPATLRAFLGAMEPA